MYLNVITSKITNLLNLQVSTASFIDLFLMFCEHFISLREERSESRKKVKFHQFQIVVPLRSDCTNVTLTLNET